MEVLKAFKELKNLSRQVRSSFLGYFFRDFDPETSDAFPLVLTAIHLKEAESTDYRSAYRQMCDWLYGWKVSDTDRSGHQEDDEFSLAKYCREIDFGNDVERSECERIMTMFETLFFITKRTMSRQYLDLEAMLPRAGQGMKTLSSLKQQKETAKEEMFPPIEPSTQWMQPEDDGSKQSLGSASSELELPEIAPGSRRESKQFQQADIDMIIVEYEKALDFNLLCCAICIVIMAFSELIDQEVQFSRFNGFCSELATDFVSFALKGLWDLLKKEENPTGSFSEFRNLKTLKLKLESVFPETQMRDKLVAIVPKFIIMQNILESVDIFVFPPSVMAHHNGVRSLQGSMLDDSLWMSCGCDRLIKIHELKAPFPCHAQYAGHTSVVTEAKFTRDDMFFVSSSFDRTVKIWNSSTAHCERTLTGHEDAVTSCDISSDARYIVSGSLDCTVRIWDFNNGSQLCVLKKHSKWVKCVKFSGDNRYLASGALDAKVFLYETKNLFMGKVSEPVRVIDSHMDIILDMAFQRPCLILTCSRDSTVRMTDFVTGKEMHSHNLGANRWASTCSFSKDGKLYALGTFDHHVLIYLTDDGSLLRTIRVFSMGIICVRFPRKVDVGHLAVGTADGFIQRVKLK